MEFLEHGRAERVKAGWHGLTAALVVVELSYNLAAYRQRGAPHLLINTLVLAGFLAFEVSKVIHHVESRACSCVHG